MYKPKPAAPEPTGDPQIDAGMFPPRPDPAVAIVEALARVTSRNLDRATIRLKCLELAHDHKWGAYYPGRSHTDIAAILFDWVLEQGQFTPKKAEDEAKIPGQSEATPAAR